MNIVPWKNQFMKIIYLSGCRTKLFDGIIKMFFILNIVEKLNVILL